MPPFDPTLINLLKKEAEKEKWRKKLKIKGKVINKRTTKKGSFFFTIKTKRTEYDVVVPKHRQNEFSTARNINVGDFVHIIGDKNIGIVFCDRIKKLNKGKEKQIKLTVQSQLSKMITLD